MREKERGERGESEKTGEHPAHVIRLRGPWEGLHGRVALPATWRSAFGESTDRATLSRRFNRPTSLGPEERVLLRIASPHRIVALRLGDSPLALTEGIADITQILAASNLLTVQLDRAGEPDTVALEAQLEIVVA